MFLRPKTLLMLASLLCAQVHALPSDSSQPVTLEADKATFNEKTGVTSYSGNVVITQGTIRIEADQLVVNLDQKRAIKDATATGRPARFQQQLDSRKGLARGEGNQLFYDARAALLTLSGNAHLQQNGTTFHGENLRYSMNKGDIEATGTSQRRVRLVIPSASELNPKSARSR